MASSDDWQACAIDAAKDTIDLGCCAWTIKKEQVLKSGEQDEIESCM